MTSPQLPSPLFPVVRSRLSKWSGVCQHDRSCGSPRRADHALILVVMSSISATRHRLDCLASCQSFAWSLIVFATLPERGACLWIGFKYARSPLHSYQKLSYCHGVLLKGATTAYETTITQTSFKVHTDSNSFQYFMCVNLS